MFEFEKYDFSKETNIKDKLFDKMKAIYGKTKNRVEELTDDDLESIFAATGIEEEKGCPFSNEACENCQNYIKNNIEKGLCRLNYKKNNKVF